MEVVMRHRVTARLEQLVRALRWISEEIEPELHLVSQEARDEWRALQCTWLSDELREGTTGFTEDQLGAISAKVHRFRNIVQSLAPKVSTFRPIRSSDNGAPTVNELFASDTSSAPAHFGPRRAARRSRWDPSQASDDLSDSSPDLKALA
jgi:hypothetical protein